MQLLYCLAQKHAAMLLPVVLKGTEGGPWERCGNTLRNILVAARSDCASGCFQAFIDCTVSESDSCKSKLCCYLMHRFAVLCKTGALTEHEWEAAVHCRNAINHQDYLQLGTSRYIDCCPDATASIDR